MVKLRAAATLAVAVALCGLTLVAVHSGIRHRYGLSDLLVLGALWVAFAGGALLVRRVRVRLAAAVILAGGAGMQVAALTAPPHTSDDVYRYVWDGRVQAAGLDPYRYVPAAPELTSLRDRFLWRPDSHWCLPPGTLDPDRSGVTLVPGCTKINRPAVHTVYPPAAEAYFAAVDAASPAGAGTLPMQAGAATSAVAVTVLLLGGLRRLDRDPRLAVLWAWCPTVTLEAGNGAHVDVLAVAFTAAALLILSGPRTRRRSLGESLLGGGLLGFAVATKLYPALTASAVLRRRPVAVLSAAVAAVIAVYLPHLLAVGGRVVGYLPGYLREEGYSTGGRFALLRLILPEAWCGPVAAAILAATTLAVLRFDRPDRPWDGALVMTGTALILTSPTYPWYAELVVLLAALAARPEWLPLAWAGYLPLFGRTAGLSWSQGTVVGYATAAAAVVIATLARATLARRASGPPRAAVPAPVAPQSQPCSLLASREEAVPSGRRRTAMP